jgi:hypothetical protein
MEAARKRCRALGFLAIFALAAMPAFAQVIRIAKPRPRPQLTAGDTLTISATPTVVSVTLVPGGTAVASSSISITTTEFGISLFSGAMMYAYFTTASQALSGGSPVSHIPSSAIYGRCPTGTPTTYTSFTSTGAFGGAGASLQVYNLTGGLLSLGFTRTDVLSLEINLSSLPQQPAAAYTGSMFLQVQAF